MTDASTAIPAAALNPHAKADSNLICATDVSNSAASNFDKENIPCDDNSQHTVLMKGCDEPKTPVSKKTPVMECEVHHSPVTPAPATLAPENSKEECSPCTPKENHGAATENLKNNDLSESEKTPAASKECKPVMNGSPITPEGNTSTLEQDNEGPLPMSSGDKIKLKPLSPTAEPFVMSSTNLFPETPKKASVSHMPLSTIDVSHNLPPMTPNRIRGSPRTSSSSPVSPNVELSAKQVRELRRLCRKTANRAEYEGRLVQLRQIASILAMGGPSLVHFAPSYLAAHSAMQAWLDAARGGGADWRDERQLSTAAVEELREWDRLLKAWAKRRFPTLADVDGGSAPPTTPRSKRVEVLNMSSPIAGNSPTPARSLVSSQQTGSPSSMRTRGSNSFVQSHMSISTDGDTINVSIVRTPDKAAASGSKSPWRSTVTPRRDQENVHPDAAESPRDWGSLRKNASANEAVNSTPLKSRNW